MKHIYQNAIKYLTYLVPNKMKLDYKQWPLSLSLSPFPHIKYIHCTPEQCAVPTSQKRHTTLYCIISLVINTRPACSHSLRYFVTGIIFYFAHTKLNLAITYWVSLHIELTSFSYLLPCHTGPTWHDWVVYTSILLYRIFVHYVQRIGICLGVHYLQGTNQKLPMITWFF